MSARPRRVFDREFKLQLCREMASGELRIAQACREYGLGRSVVERWRQSYEEVGEEAFPCSPTLSGERLMDHDLRQAQARIAALEAALGRATLENELLQRAVEKGGSRRPRGAQ